MPDQEPPRNLDELRAIGQLLDRVRAAGAYIAAREEAIKEARRIRDDAVRDLATEHGLSAAARMTGLSVSHVKVVSRH